MDDESALVPITLVLSKSQRAEAPRVLGEKKRFGGKKGEGFSVKKTGFKGEIGFGGKKRCSVKKKGVLCKKCVLGKSVSW